MICEEVTGYNGLCVKHYNNIVLTVVLPFLITPVESVSFHHMS